MVSAERGARRRAFTFDQVVDVAVGLIDEGGADALSIRSVAGRLGVNPNAVYTYVPSRAALERAVTERVLSEVDVDLLTDGSGPWAEHIVAFAHAVRDALLAHPAVAGLLMTAPMDGAPARAIREQLLAVFVGAGIDDDDAARLTDTVIVHVIGSVAPVMATCISREQFEWGLRRILATRNSGD